MNRIGTQNLETPRCLLRRIRLADYKMMFETRPRQNMNQFAAIFHLIRLRISNPTGKKCSDGQRKENQRLIGTINLGSRYFIKTKDFSSNRQRSRKYAAVHP